MSEKARRRTAKSDDDSEVSFSESDVEGEDINDAENSSKDTPEKPTRRRKRNVSTEGSEDYSYSDADSQHDDEVKTNKSKQKEALGQVAEGSEYESAEETEDTKAETAPSIESHPKEEESLTVAVLEEGSEECITEKTEEICPEQNAEEASEEYIQEQNEEEDSAEEFLPEQTEEVSEDFLEQNEEASEGEEGEDVEEERQQGDGEECSPGSTTGEKELDFDEDRRNPQYIPKKGIFYEHDDRNNEPEVKEKEEEPPTRDRKKKLWLDEGRWGHDRFREEEQYPKSRLELIETYGYDIRNEDNAPRARRRRRYGRGPTKYDRNWEDSTAYGRENTRGSPRGAPRGGRRGFGRPRGAPRFRGRGRREFGSDDVRNGDAYEHSNTEEVPTKKEIEGNIVDERPPVIDSREFPALPSKEKEPELEKIQEKTFYSKSSSVATEPQSVRTLTFENSNYSNRKSAEREVPPPTTPPRRGRTAPFSGPQDRGRPRGAPRGNIRGDYSNRRGRGNTRQISPRFMESRVNKLNLAMEHMSLELREDGVEMQPEPQVHQSESNGVVSSHTNESSLQNMSLKGAGDSSGRPKRYSSLRQRSLPESTYQNPPPPPPQAIPQAHAPYYDTGYQTALYTPTDVPTPSTQSQSVTSPPIINPSAYQTFTPPPYPENYGLRLPVTPPPRLIPQVSLAAPQPLIAAPPPCITPSPTIMSFAPPPPAPGYHQYQYAPCPQPYAAPPPPPPQPAPPNELYQTSGITYYFPQNQPPAIRPTVQKRPKVAIPILPPPERESKRNVKKDSIQSHINYADSSNDPENDVLRTDASSQLQPTVGVES